MRITTDLLMVNPNKGFKWHQDNQNGPVSFDDALRWWTWIPEEGQQRGILRQQSPTCAEGGHSCCVDWFIQGPGAGGWGTWDCNGGANQQFEWEPRLGFCNVHSRMCVWPLPDGHGKVQLVPLPPRLERQRARPRYAAAELPRTRG